jgi:peroxiredoxin Q/BCP
MRSSGEAAERNPPFRNRARSSTVRGMIFDRAERRSAPAFSAEASSGAPISLADYRGKHLVLYFYPGSFTLICTRETVAFRDAASELRALGAEVVGISPDPLDTQCKFAEHYQTSFPIVADPENRIAREYGVVFPVLPRVKRVTFVIDGDGRIAARFHHELLWHRHIDDALDFLRGEQRT